MAEIHFLGTGGSAATPQRDNTSVLLRTGNGLILIDCPGSVAAKIRKLGFEPGQVTTVILTHIHPDHIYGLPSLVHSQMLVTGEIRVMGSEATVEFSGRLLDLFGLRRRKIRTRIRFRVLRPGQKVRLEGPCSVRALPVPHHHSSLAYHFYLEGEGREILFSGDTPVHEPLFADARGVDCLVHDASAPSRYFSRHPVLSRLHTSFLALGRWSQEAGVRCLVPCHFLAEAACSAAEVRREIRRHFKGRLIVPRDLQSIRL
ncbi:MAG: ribonuclease Z [Candidatus Aminicenantales bacterium]